DYRDLPSFPTRRSSDLFGLVAGQAGYSNLDPQFTFWVNLSLVALWFALDSRTPRSRLGAWAVLGVACGMGFMTKGFLAWLLPVRSEEHTSELQSRENLV